MARVPTELILAYHRMPGDAIVLSALVRDLKRTYPQMHVGVRVPHMDVFRHNPYVETITKRNAPYVELSAKPGIKQAGTGMKIHFLRALHDAVQRQCKFPVPTLEPKPELYFGPDEGPPLSGKYWVMLAGGKANIPLKHWSWESYQRVADGMRAMGLTVVQAGSLGRGHVHQKLEGVVDMVGKTNLREFLVLIKHSAGVVCPVTAAMHAAAACEKPCVVIAGGREEPWWEEYSNRWPGAFGPEADGKVRVEHRFLDTLGQLPCCHHRGCWKKLLHGAVENKCRQVDFGDPRQALARCMSMITPEQVLAAVRSYEQTPMTGHSNFDDFGDVEIIRSLEPRKLYVQSATPVEIASPLNDAPDVPLLDNPILGGKITLAMVLYGNYHQLHVRLLESLLKTVPLHRAQLRVGLNEVCEETQAYLRTWLAKGYPVELYNHPENAKKYPVMREMLHSPDKPLRTNYLVWFDDDSYVVQDNWLSTLAETIIHAHPQGYRLYGALFKHSLRSRTEAGWFQQAGWHRGRPFQDDRQRDTPNGDKIWFVAGGFWACASDVVKSCDIPDPRLYHNGGDITIGEQVHQGGWKIKAFNTGKTHVHSSGAPRRGYSEEFPWRSKSS